MSGALVSDESCRVAAPPVRPVLYSRCFFLLGGILDAVSFALFYLPFSTLTHFFGAIFSRFLAED
jgi:hypothetical protein